MKMQNLKMVVTTVMIAMGLAAAMTAAASAGLISTETATASSELPLFGGRLAVDAVNNDGITINSPDLTTDGQITHNNSPGDMWIVDLINFPSGNPANYAIGQILTVDVGARSDLQGMRIWNFNEAGGGSDAGISVYDLETSRDGVTWTLQQDDQGLARANESGTYAGVFSAVNWQDTRFVRFTIVDTYRGGDDVGGLAEVMFDGTAKSSIITGETATASSEEISFGGRLAVDAVNNDGITINSLDLITDGQIEHNNNPGDMWAIDNLPTGNPPNTAIGQTLTVDLGGPYDVDAMRVWNFNEGGNGTDAGIELVDVETSLDNVNWNLQLDDQLLARAPGGGLNGYDGELFSALTWDNVRYVRFTIVDTYRADNDVGGLAEVMFRGMLHIPEPSSVVLLLLGAVGLVVTNVRRRRRR